MPILLALIASTAWATPGTTRPDSHAYQIPWWERELISLPPPEATAPPASQPYSLGEFAPIEGVILTTWYGPGGFYTSIQASYLAMIEAMVVDESFEQRTPPRTMLGKSC